ncbi:MmgE/Prp family protein [Mycolicibacterium litorale]|uniref:MmgE/Prp family protein n=1 Tax=Mycolicibacterium litorale TaxID=758802 RepID=A0A6S6NZ84_9MYCO|nr:MmgE/PrpD family protein [Mycolicibacterium litorale]BCI51794.1 MmgE/Prp family protein [Mycolicibacterium litorale]
MTHSVESELSRFVAELEWDDVPAPVQKRVLDIWADTLANALAGRRAANTAVVQQLADRLCGPGESTVIGGATASLTAAALINGHQITAFTMCDVYRPALCHITPEVVPAALAVAEGGDVGGRELLTGLAVGLEVTARLGLGIDYPSFRGKGWHTPGIIGTVGAACAAARVIGLNDRGVRAAMGLGVSQASGTFAALGTPAVKFHQGRGAVSGLWAAMFTADGLGGTERGLTHSDGGLFTTYADGGRPELVTEGLGRIWELEQISLRRWPAASSLQSLVAALLELGDDLDPLEAIASVEIALPPTPFEMCAHVGWDDELTAMQSTRYVTAVVLTDRRCWIDSFGAVRRADPTLVDFAAHQVTVVRDDTLPPTGVEVRIVAGGRVSALRRDRAPGEPREPLTRSQIDGKVEQASAGTPIAAAGRLDDVTTRVGDRRVVEVCVDLRTTAAANRGGNDREYAASR